MSRVKEIRIDRIDSHSANLFVRKHHYSGSVVSNSQLHFGAFLDSKLHGVLQFGPSLDKKKVIGLVKDTGWNGFTELNRMAFDKFLPKNSESRCIGICLRLLRKHCPQIKWVLSFADGTQCGDGTIYRASGFYLTQINVNKSIWEAPDGEVATDLSLRLGLAAGRVVCKHNIEAHKMQENNGASSMRVFKEAGYKVKKGFQLRYIYFIDKEKVKDLTVPIIPFSKIKEMGAEMYKGKKGGGSL